MEDSELENIYRGLDFLVKRTDSTSNSSSSEWNPDTIENEPKKKRKRRHKKKYKSSDYDSIASIRDIEESIRTLNEETEIPNNPRKIPIKNIIDKDFTPSDTIQSWQYLDLQAEEYNNQLELLKNSSCDELEDEYYQTIETYKTQHKNTNSTETTSPSSDDKDIYNGSHEIMGKNSLYNTKQDNISPIPSNGKGHTQKIDRSNIYKPCFGCMWSSQTSTSNEAISNLFKLARENLGRMHIIQLCKVLHVFFRENIYKPLKSSKRKDVFIWRTHDIYTHFMDFRHTLNHQLDTYRELYHCHLRLEILKKMEFKILTYDNGTNGIFFDQKISTNINNLQKRIQDLYSRKLNLSNNLALSIFNVYTQ